MRVKVVDRVFTCQRWWCDFRAVEPVVGSLRYGQISRHQALLPRFRQVRQPCFNQDGITIGVGIIEGQDNAAGHDRVNLNPLDRFAFTASVVSEVNAVVAGILPERGWNIQRFGDDEGKAFEGLIFQRAADRKRDLCRRRGI